MNKVSEFGFIGLGVMGKSLALNMAHKGIPLSVYNRHVPGQEEDIARKFIDSEGQNLEITGFDDLKAFVKSLKKPRKIMIMVKAGGAVDHILNDLIPHLSENDLIIDGGNSHYKDTARRINLMESKGMFFLGTGISGGEEGALKGPSIMPGGSKAGYERASKYLEAIAAKDKNGNPCCSYIGPDGSGHYVKMVHNGIEYAEMQAITEVYGLLRFYAGLSLEEIAGVLEQWKADGLGSYLLEITIDILRKKEDDHYLLDKVLDRAQQKGTGSWTVEAALLINSPVNTISDALMARYISSLKHKRVQAEGLYGSPSRKKINDTSDIVRQLKSAYQGSRIINHIIGFDLIKSASNHVVWNLDMSEIARIWTNGCIIRSRLMEEISVLAHDYEDSLLFQPEIEKRLKNYKKDWCSMICEGLANDISLPVISSAYNYLLGITTGNSSANLIQAQRDYFGAHTYERVDKPLKEYFHSDWKSGE